MAKSTTSLTISALIICLGMLPFRVDGQTPSTSVLLDVAGVKLGMTIDEAETALRGFDPDIEIDDRIKNPGNPDLLLGNQIFDSHWAIVGMSKDLATYKRAVTNELAQQNSCNAKYPMKDGDGVEARVAAARAGEACQDEQNKSNEKVRRATLQTPRMIAVWFSPTPGTEKVIAVSSSTSFIKSVPSVDALATAITKKYGSPSHCETASSGGEQTMWWKLDPRGRLMTGKRVEREGRFDRVGPSAILNECYDEQVCPHLMLPTQFMSDDGIVLVADVQGGAQMSGDIRSGFSNDTQTNPNPLLSPEVDVVLYNGGGLYAYTDQARALSLHAAKVRNEAEAAKTSRTVPKF